MTQETEKPETAEDSALMSWVDFLQDHPPGGPVTVSKAIAFYQRETGGIYKGISQPPLSAFNRGGYIIDFLRRASVEVGFQNSTISTFLLFRAPEYWLKSSI